MDAGRLEPGAFPPRPAPGFDSAPASGKFPLFAEPTVDATRSGRAPAHRSDGAWLERLARIARRRGRFGLLLLGAFAALDAFVAGNWSVTQRAQATVLVDPARSVDAELRAHLPALPERLGALLAQATADSFLESELLAGNSELAEVHWLDEALDSHAGSTRAERLRQRITLSVEGLERSPVIRVGVRGERVAEVELIASRVAGRLVALDRAFRSDDARARREGAARDPGLDPAPLARVEAELAALRRDNPRVALETDSSVRAQLAELEAREAQDASRETELTSAVPLLEAEEAQRHSGVADEAAAARHAAAQVGPGGRGPVATAEAPAPRVAGSPAGGSPAAGSPTGSSPTGGSPGAGSSDEASDRFVLEAAGYVAWRDCRARLEAARTQLKAARTLRLARAPELARARELALRWPELHGRLTLLEGERERAAAALEAARRRLAVAERLAAVELGGAPDGARLERLVLADPACRLEPPEGPDRTFVFLVGLAVSALGAVLAAVWRELRDRSLHTSEDAARALGVPVLGVVPRLRGRR